MKVRSVFSRIFLFISLIAGSTYNLSCTSFANMAGVSGPVGEPNGLQDDIEPEQLSEAASGDVRLVRQLEGLDQALQNVVVIQPVSRRVASLLDDSIDHLTSVKECSEFVLPSKVRISILKEGVLQKTVVLDYNGKQVARFEQSSSKSGRYEVYDMQNQLLLTGSESRTGGAAIELKDCRGRNVGRIVQDNEKSFIGAVNSYSILGSDGQMLFNVDSKSNDSPTMTTLEMTDRNSAKWAQLIVAKKLKRFEAAITGEVMSPEHTALLLATLKLYVSGPRP